MLSRFMLNGFACCTELSAGQTAQIGIGIDFFLPGSTVQEILDPLIGGMPDFGDGAR